VADLGFYGEGATQGGDEPRSEIPSVGMTNCCGQNNCCDFKQT